MSPTLRPRKKKRAPAKKQNQHIAPSRSPTRYEPSTQEITQRPWAVRSRASSAGSTPRSRTPVVAFRPARPAALEGPQLPVRRPLTRLLSAARSRVQNAGSLRAQHAGRRVSSESSRTPKLLTRRPLGSRTALRVLDVEGARRRRRETSIDPSFTTPGPRSPNGEAPRRRRPEYFEGHLARQIAHGGR